jgi:hypothetical protein
LIAGLDRIWHDFDSDSSWTFLICDLRSVLLLCYCVTWSIMLLLLILLLYRLILLLLSHQ